MVHSMTPKAGLLCMMAAYLTRVPIRVHTFTGLVWPTETGFKRKLLMLTDKITCFCATHIIPEGDGVKMDLLNHRITKKPLKVLGYGNVKGVDMEYYSSRDEVRWKMEELKLRDESKFTFVFVGRIDHLCELLMYFVTCQLQAQATAKAGEGKAVGVTERTHHGIGVIGKGTGSREALLGRKVECHRVATDGCSVGIHRHVALTELVFTVIGKGARSRATIAHKSEDAVGRAVVDENLVARCPLDGAIAGVERGLAAVALLLFDGSLQCGSGRFLVFLAACKQYEGCQCDC